jgi:hypothetical protein
MAKVSMTNYLTFENVLVYPECPAAENGGQDKDTHDVNCLYYDVQIACSTMAHTKDCPFNHPKRRL